MEYLITTGGKVMTFNEPIKFFARSDEFICHIQALFFIVQSS